MHHIKWQERDRLARNKLIKHVTKENYLLILIKPISSNMQSKDAETNFQTPNPICSYI